MSIGANKTSLQFSLRSLLMGFIWLAFLLGICVQYQRTSAKQRELIGRIRAAGAWPITPRRVPPASQPNPSTDNNIDLAAPR
jgi:hypothetical protein